MSKQSLNLSVEKSIKERAKRIARTKGISVSQFFEDMVLQEEDPDEYMPGSGTAAYEIYNLISEEDKVDHYNYKKRKEEALKDKYGL